jgi:galactokinase/mevalonate kinase-like predicted kinase
VVVTLPARFDFIGGWTDTPPYYFENPAAVLNSAVALRSLGSKQDYSPAVTIKVSPASQFSYCVNGEVMEKILPSDGVGQGVFYFLNLYRPPISVSIENKIPRGSGLGGSSLLALGLLTALRSYWEGAQQALFSPRESINDVLAIEQLIGSGGGWQDQIGGLLPGVKLIEAIPGEESYHVSYLSEDKARVLESSTLMLDTRLTRQAVVILSSIREKYINREATAVAMLNSIRQNAQSGFESLEKGDVRGFGHLLHSSWSHVCAVESAISSVLPDSIRSLPSVVGYKLGGAGGGGFLMALAEEPSARVQLAKELQIALPHSIIYEPSFTAPGLKVFQDGEEYSVSLASDF